MENLQQLIGQIDIFQFRAYVEETNAGSIGTTAWKIFTELFVNIIIFIQNLIVLIFSQIIGALDKFSLYDTFKESIFTSSKEIWQTFLGGKASGVQSGSIIGVLLSLSAMYLFFSWAFSIGNYTKKVLHLLVVVALGFGYFGTISGTSGGLFIIDKIHAFSDEVINSLNTVSVSIGDDVVTSSLDLKESYIKETAYTTYLYVNTGRIDGQFFNNQTQELEAFPTEDILGRVDENGQFVPVKSKDRDEKIDKLGNEALENNEKNRWVSAVGDFFFMKLGYAVSSVYKAIVKPLPYILVLVFRTIAEIGVLILMFLFPLFLLLSFIPAMQEKLIGFIRGMLIFSVLPMVATVMLLVCSMVDLLLLSGFNVLFSSEGKDDASNLMVSSFTTSIISVLVYWLFWKYKGTIASLFFSGSSKYVSNSSYNPIEEVRKRADRSYFDETSLGSMGGGYDVRFGRSAEQNEDRIAEVSPISEDISHYPERDEIHVPEQMDIHSPERDEARVPEQMDIHSPERDEARVLEQTDTHFPERDEVYVPEQDETYFPERDDVQFPEQSEVEIPEGENISNRENMSVSSMSDDRDSREQLEQTYGQADTPIRHTDDIREDTVIIENNIDSEELIIE